jgi:hypothetical protein
MKTIPIIFSFLMVFCLVNTLAQIPHTLLKSTNDFGSPPDWRWAQQYGGTSADVGNDIVTDENGNIYITGSFSGNLSYPGYSFTSIGKRDAFVAKYNSSGTIQWFKQFPASGSGEFIDAYGIERDNAGHLYITGYYTGSTLLGTFPLADMGPTNYFFARLDASGNVELAGGPTFPHDDQETGTVIKVDDNGNIYMLISNTLNRLSVTNYSSLFCFDEYGYFQWVYSDSTSIFDIELSNNKIFYSGTINIEGYIGPFYLDPPSTSDAFLAMSDLDGNFEWAEIPGHGGSDGISQGRSISLDENGNIYQCGYFVYDVIFGETQLTGYSSYLVKADPDGGYLWASSVFANTAYEISGNSNFLVVFSTPELIKYNSSSGEVIATELITHSPDKLYYCDYNDRIVTTGDFEQNIYISSFNSGLDLQWLWQFNSDSGLGFNVGTRSDKEGNIYSFNYASNPMDYQGETVGDGMFLAKQDNSGNLIWLRNFYGIKQGYDLGCYVTVDDLTASVYITGTFTEPFEIPGITTLYPGENGSFYIIRYDLNGNYIWHTQADGAFYYNCLAIDHSGNALLSAVFMGTVTIGTQELVSDGGSNDAFVAKYNANGQFMWATRGGGESEEYMGLISTDDQDNVYFTGEFDSENVTFGDQSITLNEGDGNILLAKLNSSGQVLWLKVKGGSPVGYNEYWCWPTSIVTDHEGYSYVKGWHGDSAYFDNILLRNPFSVKKNYNFFIARFDPSGNTLWAHSINESQSGQDYNMMDIDAGGNVYFGAQIRDSIWFGYDYLYKNPGYPSSYDLFIAKYSAGGIPEWIKILPSSNPAGGTAWLSSITVLAENDLIMGGNFKGTLNLDAFILNSNIAHGMIAYLGDPLSVKESPDLSPEFFTIYPNPAKDRLTVSFPEEITGEMNITVSDLSGKLLMQSSAPIKFGRINLNVSEIPAGMYFLQVNNQQQSDTKKLIIH